MIHLYVDNFIIIGNDKDGIEVTKEVWEKNLH